MEGGIDANEGFDWGEDEEKGAYSDDSVKHRSKARLDYAKTKRNNDDEHSRGSALRYCMIIKNTAGVNVP